MKFNCSICSYSTDIYFNYNKHLNTKKHAKNVEHQPKCTTKSQPQTATTPSSNKEKQNEIKNKELICSYCNVVFSRLSSLVRHKEKCTEKENSMHKLKELLKEKDNKIKELEKDIYYLKKIEQDNEYHKDLVLSAGQLAQTSMSAVKYISHNYKNTPAIEKFDNFELQEIDNMKLGDDMTYYYKEKLLAQEIGDMIVDVYKKDNPHEQALWNTDATRLAYIVRELINDKPEWNIDKGGIKVAEYCVAPVLEYLKEEMRTYIAELAVKEDITFKETDKMKEANMIIKEIDEGTLHK